MAIYQALPRAGAVIHAHPPAATGYAQAGLTIDTTSSSEAYAVLGREVPLIPYDRPTTPQLAEIVKRAVTPQHKAYLMANHGVVVWGDDLWDAYDILDTLEIFTQSLIVATLVGRPQPIPPEELRWLDEKYGGN